MSKGKTSRLNIVTLKETQDRVPSFVTELLQLKVDVVVATTLTTVRIAKQKTQTVPIVMAIPDDPVALGLVDSLAHPGGNITGLTRLSRDLSGKRLDLLKEAVPGLARVAVLSGTRRRNTSIPRSDRQPFVDYETPARGLKIALQILEVSESESGSCWCLSRRCKGARASADYRDYEHARTQR